MKHSHLTVILLSYVLSACAHLPGFDAQQTQADIATQTAGEVQDLPTFWAAIGRQSAYNQIQWANDFHDPILESYINKALQENRNLIIAEARIRQAAALTTQAKAGRLPYVGYGLSATRGGLIKNSSLDSATIQPGSSGSWSPDIWGRIKSSEYAAQASTEAAIADYKAAQNAIAHSVADIYFQIIGTEVQAQIARDTVTALSENMRIVNAQYGDGVVSGQEPALTESDLATARQSVLVAENAKDQLKLALEILLNKYPENALKTPSNFSAIPTPPEVGIPASLLETRPDIVAAERQIAAAFYSLEQAKVAHLPEISLTGTLGTSSNGLLDALDPTNIAWSAATSILGPLYDAGVLKANVEIAKASQKQALANYRLVALGAFNDVEVALLNIQSLLAQEAELKLANDRAKEALHIANIRYEAGEISLVDVLTIQQRTFGTGSNLALVRQDIFTTYVDLNLAVGGSWQK